jgi:hypothetical protein
VTATTLNLVFHDCVRPLPRHSRREHPARTCVNDCAHLIFQTTVAAPGCEGLTHRNQRANAAKDAKTDKQHGAVVSAELRWRSLLDCGLIENINGNYAIADKPLSEQEWAEQHTSKH